MVIYSCRVHFACNNEFREFMADRANAAAETLDDAASQDRRPSQPSDSDAKVALVQTMQEEADLCAIARHQDYNDQGLQLVEKDDRPAAMWYDEAAARVEEIEADYRAAHAANAAAKIGTAALRSYLRAQPVICSSQGQTELIELN